MEPKYRDRLPSHLLPLVERIEESSGAEVVIEHDAGLESSAAACPQLIDGAFRPLIRFRGEPDITSVVHPEPYSIFCHELLHLERYFVEWVPLMELRGFTMSGGSENMRRRRKHLESYLEHLVIEPRQKEYGFRVVREGWDAKYWYDVAPVRPDDWWMLQDWLDTDFLAPEEARAAARRALLPEMLVVCGEQINHYPARCGRA